MEIPKNACFSVDFQKTELKINRKTKGQTNKAIEYYMKFIDNCRFMSTSSPHLTANLFENFYRK